MDLIALENQATLGCASPSGLATHRGAPTGGYHHRQRVCQPSGLERVQRLKESPKLQFGFRPGGPTDPLPGSKAPVAMHLQPPQARRADRPWI